MVDANHLTLIDNFENGMSPRWETKSFAGVTDYTVVREGDRSYLKATSKAAASGLFYKIKYDPQKKPLLTWSWKVENILSEGDARSKKGDDYPARIYVVFPSLFFWNTKVLNYIWANKLPKGEAVHSSFTSNSVMIAVQSGEDLAGEWVIETRNIYKDYIRNFGKEPPAVGAIAIMTDTDNTGQEATAYYGPISIGTE